MPDGGMQRLREVLAAEDTVLFVGSGISCWSGLPTWECLLLGLAERIDALGRDSSLVRREIDRGDHLQAADFAADTLSNRELAEALRHLLAPGPPRPSRAHELLIGLGPTCYITTNYDRLLEEALRTSRPDERFAAYTNRQVVETADIVQARATHFVYKPHGDVDDFESLVLAHRHYRNLVTRRPNAVEALKILLASRRVVYIGFGLRDPSFKLVADHLLTTFDNAGLDHWALMPDIEPGEVDYWRRRYGITVVSYRTSIRPDGTTSHDQLLDLLEDLGARPRPTPAPSHDAQRTLDLARYANALAMRHGAVAELLPLNTRRRSDDDFEHRPRRRYWFARYHAPLEELLLDTEESTVLVGSPGAGKTHGMRHAVGRLAVSLRDSLLSEAKEIPTVPFFVDLREYEGDLRGMVEATLPAGLRLRDVLDHRPCRFYLDAANEAADKLQVAVVEDVIRFVEDVRPHVVVVSTRYPDHFRAAGFPTFVVDDIDAHFVQAAVEESDGAVAGHPTVVGILRRPFFFQLYRSGTINLAGVTTPPELFARYVESLGQAAARELGAPFDLREALPGLAYELQRTGRDAVNMDDVVAALAGGDDQRGKQRLEWLVRRQVLFPLPGRRLNFAHQLLTEYLAAFEMARLYTTRPELLQEWLRHRSWDQTLLLASSLLGEEDRRVLVDTLLRTDPMAAVHAVAYLDLGRSEATSSVLAWLDTRPADEPYFDLRFEAMSMLPVDESHEPALRALFERGADIGSVAGALLVKLRGREIVPELLERVLRGDDQAMTKGLGRAVGRAAHADDLRDFIARLAAIEVPPKPDGRLHTMMEASADVLSCIPPTEVRRFFDVDDLAGAQRSVLARYLRNCIGCVDTAHLAAECCERDPGFVLSLFHQLRFIALDEETLDELCRAELVEVLVAQLAGDRAAKWAAATLVLLAGPGRRCTELLRERAAQHTGWARVVLLHAATGLGVDLVRGEIRHLVESGGLGEQSELARALDKDVWARLGPEVVEAILLADDPYATPDVIDAICLGNTPAVTIAVDDVRTWVDRLCRQSDRWYRHRLGHYLAVCLGPGQLEDLLAVMMERPDTRAPIVEHVLMSVQELRLETLDEDVLAVVVEECLMSTEDEWDLSVLGEFASPTFVEQRLLPLLDRLGSVLRPTLLGIIRQCGTRHARRYVAEDGTPL